jgi:hypothetical protein
MTKIITKPRLIAASLVVAVALASTGAYVLGRQDSSSGTLEHRAQNGSTAQQANISTESAARIDETAKASSVRNETLENKLLYLIEEEKLAHDVYTKMYELWGANVFGSILESEATHQSRVLELLQARSIADPRSSEIGVFKNAELQKLYNDLIAQGSQSAGEAFKVGVAIEEKDIADITVQLATAKDSDVVSTLEALRRGSENHLRAFNRQLE